MTRGLPVLASIDKGTTQAFEYCSMLNCKLGASNPTTLIFMVLPGEQKGEQKH